MLDAIALAEGISMQTIQHKALIGKGISFEETIVHSFVSRVWGFGNCVHFVVVSLKNCEHLSCGVELTQNVWCLVLCYRFVFCRVWVWMKAINKVLW